MFYFTFVLALSQSAIADHRVILCLDGKGNEARPVVQVFIPIGDKNAEADCVTAEVTIFRELGDEVMQIVHGEYEGEFCMKTRRLNADLPSWDARFLRRKLGIDLTPKQDWLIFESIDVDGESVIREGIDLHCRE